MEDYYLSHGEKDKYKRMSGLMLMYDPKYKSFSGGFAQEVAWQKIDIVIIPRKLHYLAENLDQSSYIKIIATKKYSVYKIK